MYSGWLCVSAVNNSEKTSKILNPKYSYYWNKKVQPEIEITNPKINSYST